jgi:hypothetical protein
MRSRSGGLLALTGRSRIRKASRPIEVNCGNSGLRRMLRTNVRDMSDASSFSMNFRVRSPLGTQSLRIYRDAGRTHNRFWATRTPAVTQSRFTSR